MTEQAAPTTEKAQLPPAPPGVLEWFTRAQTLRAAKSFRSQLHPVERLALERALRAQELADRAYDPVDPLRSGSSLALSISLYREAAYWGLRAQNADYTGATLEALFDAAPAELIELAAGGPDGSAQARRALVERSFVETAALPPELLPADAEAARAFVAALLRAKLAPEARVGRALVERALRIAALLLVVAAVVLGTWSGLARMRRGPDLAAGKPWTASSSPDICHPTEHHCAGTHTDMFFTTSEEANPWLEIDLGRDSTFNRVEVKNRSDCCPDRATPLIIEVSRDRNAWQEVSRRSETFTIWEAAFGARTARYVRLRVPRRTTFHLDKVSVRYDR